MKYHSLYLTIHFNKAVFFELKNKFEEAIHTLQNLIQFNKYYIDASIKKADILHRLGRKIEAYSSLNELIT